MMPTLDAALLCSFRMGSDLGYDSGFVLGAVTRFHGDQKVKGNIGGWVDGLK